MKKISIFVLALTLALGTGIVFTDSAKADVQLDKGQQLSTAARVFFVARNARGAAGNRDFAGGTVISADSVVIWDTTSNDGVTVTITTTSHDALVAGVTIDDIPGSSRDNTAANDEGYNNWGRVQTWGRHANTRFQVCAAPYSCVAGMRVGTGSTSGDAAIFRNAPTSVDASTTFDSSSRDSFGVLLEAPGSTDLTADVFIKNT